MRQDLLDQVVWSEIIRLLENPSLIQGELDRRLAAAQTSDPTQRREKTLHHDLKHIRKSMDRLVSAYQEDLIPIDELRDRLPTLQQREQAIQAELPSTVDRSHERATYLRLAETLTEFLSKLHSSAQNLDVQQRQRIVRLLVKEVLVGDDTIIIRHAIPVPTKPSNSNQILSTIVDAKPIGQSYLLRSGSALTTAGQPIPAFCLL